MKTIGTHFMQHRPRREIITTVFTKRSSPHALGALYSAKLKPVNLSFEVAIEPCATRTKYLWQSYSLCRQVQVHPGPVQLAQDLNFILQQSATAAAHVQRATVHDICPPLTHGSEDFYDTRNSLAAYLRLGYTFVDNPTVTGFSYSPHSITIKKVSSRNVRRRRDRDIVPGRALWGGDARRDRPTDRRTIYLHFC